MTADLGDPASRATVCVEDGNIADNEMCLTSDADHEMSAAIFVDLGP